MSAASLLLGACQTTGSKHHAQLSQDRAGVDQAIARAAHLASREGAKQESLLFHEELYRRNPQDEAVMLKYTTSLRRSGNVAKARLILSGWASDRNASAEIHVAMAKTVLADGALELAHIHAEKAVEKEGRNPHALHVKGLAEDALGDHEAAEKSLRKALKHWKGPPVKLLNNLALNLSAQQRKIEALEVIDQALIYAPHHPTLKNNRALIAGLNPVPKPARRPAG